MTKSIADQKHNDQPEASGCCSSKEQEPEGTDAQTAEKQTEQPAKKCGCCG
ncbi:MAG: hypothetical protein AAFW97_12210 [Pseudomonadota bacterium]